MGKDSTTGKIGKYHILELIEGLAFLRFPLQKYGYTIDNGIVLISENERTAYQIMNALTMYLDATEIHNLKKGFKEILNFKMGVHIYKKTDKDEEIINYMYQNDFIPVVLIGGIVPNILYDHSYILKADITDDEIKKFSKISNDFKEKVIDNLENILKIIATFNPSIRYNNNNYKNFLTVSLIIHNVWEFVKKNLRPPLMRSTKTWSESFQNFIRHATILMEDFDGSDNIQDAVRECILNYMNSNKDAVILDISEICEDTDLEKIIVYDQEFYFIKEEFLRTICRPILGIQSFLQLKNDMYESGMIECNGTKNRNYTVKVSIPHNKRIRCIRIRKECLASEEGMPLEYILSRPNDETDTISNTGSTNVEESQEQTDDTMDLY